MPLIDATNEHEKPTISFYPHEQAMLPFIKEGESYKPTELALALSFEGEVQPVQKYDLAELRQFTFTLMQYLSISYEKPEVPKSLQLFSAEEKQKLRPFAYFLAALDGNCFDELIDQYIPDAYAIITHSGHTDLRSALKHIFPKE